MRLIDADALKTPIEDRIDNIPASDYDNGWNNAIYAVIDEIDNTPTVETSKIEKIKNLSKQTININIYHKTRLKTIVIQTIIE